MDLHEDLVVEKVQHAILDTYLEIGSFQNENNDSDKGKFFFSDTPGKI